jgi:hypothetical protein
LAEEYDQDEQGKREIPNRIDIIGLIISLAITVFCVWIIDSFESAQQGFKWVILALTTLFGGFTVLFFIYNIIEKIVYDKTRYRNRIKSLPIVFLGLLFNGSAIERLYKSSERPDANGDGIFTISDVVFHAKETFFTVGNQWAVEIAKSDIGQFFEMNANPNSFLALIMSLFFGSWLLMGLFTLISGDERL